MGNFDSRKAAEAYIRMAEGFDGAEMIGKLRDYLPTGAKVLELGMGPGTDLLDLASTFEVVGSDASKAFLTIFGEQHPEIRLAQLDAVGIEIEEQFDGIYSNKVLHYLSEEKLRASFARQAEVLKEGGVGLHSFWRGEQVEEFEGVKTFYYLEETVTALVGEWFEVRAVERYAEFERDDSFYLIIQKK